MFRNRRQLPFLSALVLALPLIACLPGGGAFAEEAGKLAQKAKPPAVTVTEAKKISFVDNVLVTGSLVPREEVLVGPEIDGYRLTELLAEEGDHVHKGQVLAKLSGEILEAQLAQNAASLSKTQAATDQVHNQIVESEATLRQVEDAFNRVKPLKQSGVASQATFDDRDAAFRTARARLAALKEGLKFAEAEQTLMRAQRQELEIKLGRTDIRAPSDGIISRRTARMGAVSSSAAEPLFRIIKDAEIELDAEVPESYMPKLKTGQRARVEFEGVGERTATVRLISQEVNTSSRLGRVRIFLGAAPDLRIGMFAKAMIDAGEREAVGVASTAVLYQNESATVLAVAGDKVRERTVKAGLLFGDAVEIKEGLKEGEIVVLRAGSLLRSGDTISPQFADKQTAGRSATDGVSQ